MIRVLEYTRTYIESEIYLEWRDHYFLCVVYVLWVHNLRTDESSNLYRFQSFILQVIKTFSMREGWWYIGIKDGGGVKSKGTRLVIEKEK